LVEDKLLEFGSSKKLVKSVAHALQGKRDPPDHLWDSIEAAHQVASCGYEYSTSWGIEVRNKKIWKPFGFFGHYNGTLLLFNLLDSFSFSFSFSLSVFFSGRSGLKQKHS
jgi:hypothetical protein